MTRSATAASTRTDNGWPSGWDSTICCARHPVWPPEVGCLIPAQTGLAQRFLSYYTSPASPLAAAPGRGGGPPLGTGTLVPHARGPGTATICCNREWSFLCCLLLRGGLWACVWLRPTPVPDFANLATDAGIPSLSSIAVPSHPGRPSPPRSAARQVGTSSHLRGFLVNTCVRCFTPG